MSNRPNILVILTEDLSPHSATYGDSLSPMKSVDEIAKDALIFENAFCAAPVCAPSRFSMITGIEPASCAPAQNHAADGIVPKNIKLLTHPLKETGYYCCNYSKADYNFQADMPELWDDFSLDAHWRNREEGQPFFAFFNLTQTHESSLFRDEVTIVKPEEIELPPYLPDTQAIREDFARHYTAMDRSEKAIRKLLDELAADGLSDSTVIMQISDHGGTTPRSKRFIYDSGNKVPLIIKIPKNLTGERSWPEPGRISTAVSLIDFAPTICDIAGTEKPETMIGSSLLGILPSDQERMVFTGRDRMDENFDLIRTARTSKYLYIRNYFPNRPWLVHQAFAWQARGYQSWEEEHLAGRTNEIQERYFGEKPAEEFYDNFSDPHQINNLVDSHEHQELIVKYRDELDRRTISIFDNGFIPEGSSIQGLINSRDPKLYPIADVLNLANLTLKKDPNNIPAFVSALSSEHEVMRFWAAQGLLTLKGHSKPAESEVILGLSDTSDNVKAVLAELAVILGHRTKALAVFRELLSADKPFEILLRALTALVWLEDLPIELLDDCKKLSTALKSEAKSTSGYFNAYSATRYLIERIERTYEPSSQIFDTPLFMERMQRNSPGLLAGMQRDRT